jgi:DNA-binding NarL/FixJ family response regulator
MTASRRSEVDQRKPRLGVVPLAERRGRLVELQLERRTQYPRGVAALIRAFVENGGGMGAGGGPFTPRETEVVKLIAEGLTSREIGEVLHISDKTVERHRANVLDKLGLKDRVALTRYAIRRGLVGP